MVYTMTKKTISRVHVFPGTGTAETLGRRGEITYHHSIVYFFDNIGQKLSELVDVY